MSDQERIAELEAHNARLVARIGQLKRTVEYFVEAVVRDDTDYGGKTREAYVYSMIRRAEQTDEERRRDREALERARDREAAERVRWTSDSFRERQANIDRLEPPERD